MKNLDQHILYTAWARAVDAAMLADHNRAEADRAEAVAQAKTRFLAAMAHELNNPVNAISGYAQFLQLMQEGQRASDAARCLDSIEAASRHLTAMIDDTLLAATLDSGRTPVDLADIDLRDVLAVLDKLIRPQVEAGGNRFEMSIAEDVGTIVSDRTKVQQILINLLSNAAKFTRNGTVKLQIDRRDSGHILLRVEDTGAGMTPQQLAHLYDAFTDIGGKESRALGGTGLGMFITQNLCHLLASEISVISTPGKGTCFEVVLPAIARQELKIARPARERTLVIGVREELPHSDPHLNATEIDFYCAQHMFEGLTVLDREGRIQPCLAAGWERTDPLTWEIELKPGVTFHDGSPFEADDVLATFQRLHRIARGGLNNNQILAIIKSVRALNSHRLQVVTAAAHRALPLDLVEVHIINRRFIEASTYDFDSGQAAIGTGPFRQIERRPTEIRLEAFTRYHGQRSLWLEVDFVKAATRDDTRAKVQRGDIDLVYALPLDWRTDYETPGSDSAFAAHPGLMMTFLAPNFLPRLNGACFDADGRPIEANPLLDRRVRDALSLAIDRVFLCQVLLGGLALPAGDIVPPAIFGADPSLVADRYDPSAAKALLDAAGHGRGLTINAAYSDDVPPYQMRTLRAVEIMLAGIGVQIRWTVLPRDQLHDHANAERYGLKYQYWTCSTGDSFYNLEHLVASPDEASGYGATNFGRYANPILDDFIRAADQADDEAQRLSALRAAGALAMSDRAILPLYFPHMCWAYRRGYRPLPNAQAATLAKWVVPG